MVKVKPVLVPAPLTVKTAGNGDDVPIPTLPWEKMENELVPVVVMDGVVPENVNAALLPVKVAEVNDGVEVTPNAPAVLTRLDPVKSVMVSPARASPVNSAVPATLIPAEKLAPDVTESDWPIPTLPVTLSDEPIPTKPENLPVPNTSKAYTGEDVPIPSL